MTHLIILLLTNLLLFSPPTVAEPLLTPAEQAFQRGDFRQAITEWEAVIQHYVQSPQPLPHSLALSQQAEAYQRLGYYPEAIHRLHQALKLVETMDNKPLQATFLANLGYWCALVTHSSKPLREECQPNPANLLEKGLQLATGQAAVTALLLINRGNVSALDGEWSIALRDYQQAATLAKQANHVNLLTKALTNAATCGLLETDQCETASSEEWLRQTLEYLKPLPDSHDKAYALLSVGQLTRLLTSRTTLPSPVDLFQQALQMAHRLVDKRTESYALGYLGELYEKAQRYEEAERLLQQAIFVAQEINDTDSLLLRYLQKARLFTQQGQLEPAITTYFRTVSYLEQLRQDLESCRQRRELGGFQQSIQIYRELLDLLLQRALLRETVEKRIDYCETLPSAPTLAPTKTSSTTPQRENPASPCGELPPQRTLPTTQAQCDLRNAQLAAERMKDAELRDYFQDDCVTGTQTCPMSLEQPLPARDHTAVIYPLLLHNSKRVVMLLDLPTGLQPVLLTTSPEHIDNFAKALSRDLRQKIPGYKEYAIPLYDELIRPIDGFLTSPIDTLVIIPEGALRTIPWAVLYDSQRHSYLIEQYALATTQGLTLTDARPLSRQSARLLLGGLSQQNPHYPEFPPLPGVRKEIEAVQQLYPDSSQVLLDEQFVQDQMQQQLAGHRYSMVLIASHAQFNPKSRDSFILTFDPHKLTMDKLEGFVKLGQLADKQPVELLTLSACQTAEGDDRASLGLAGVAVKAGAYSVLASLWPVDDESTAQLIQRFYQVLKESPNLPKVKVWQQVQQEWLKKKSHPFYWSPFLLIGNWL